jgi:hypothetical protein
VRATGNAAGPEHRLQLPSSRSGSVRQRFDCRTGGLREPRSVEVLTGALLRRADQATLDGHQRHQRLLNEPLGYFLRLVRRDNHDALVGHTGSVEAFRDRGPGPPRSQPRGSPGTALRCHLAKSGSADMTLRSFRWIDVPSEWILAGLSSATTLGTLNEANTITHAGAFLTRHEPGGHRDAT